MSVRDDRTADERSSEAPRAELTGNAVEGGGPDSVGALDGAAVAGGLGAVGSDKPDSVMPHDAPDPTIGPRLSSPARLDRRPSS